MHMYACVFYINNVYMQNGKELYKYNYTEEQTSSDLQRPYVCIYLLSKMTQMQAALVPNLKFACDCFW